MSSFPVSGDLATKEDQITSAVVSAIRHAKEYCESILKMPAGQQVVDQCRVAGQLAMGFKQQLSSTFVYSLPVFPFFLLQRTFSVNYFTYLFFNIAVVRPYIVYAPQLEKTTISIQNALAQLQKCVNDVSTQIGNRASLELFNQRYCYYTFSLHFNFFSLNLFL